jgi:hypothetical protein
VLYGPWIQMMIKRIDDYEAEQRWMTTRAPSGGTRDGSQPTDPRLRVRRCA